MICRACGNKIKVDDENHLATEPPSKTVICKIHDVETTPKSEMESWL